jgi:putative ABC transport system substrate-binding protein
MVHPQAGIAFLSVLAGAVLCAAAPAQDRPWQIGVLMWHRPENDLQALAGLETALRVAGRPHQLLVEDADSSAERAVAALERFRARPVDLVVALGTQAALLCRQHLPDLPVVFTAVTDPVESGVVPSWAGSGRNLAGNSNRIAPETVLAMFRRAVPDLRRLGILRSAETGVVSLAELRAMERHLAELPAGRPRVELVEEIATGVEDLGAAVGRLAAAGCQAVWIPIDFLVYENMGPVTAAAAARRLPLVSSSLAGATSGAVVGVVVDYEMLGERAALLVLEILARGRDPGSLPIGTMQGYQVVVNLAAARRLGYDLPLPLLALADRLLDDEGDGGRR